MKRSKVTIIAIAIAVYCPFGILAVAAESITVGVVACLSGGCAEWGVATKNGLELAQDEINSAGGFKGKRVDLKFEDTNEATSAAQAVTAFRKLRSSRDIHFFIGPSWTPAGLALAPIVGKMADVVMISPSLGVAEFNEAAPNLFNTMMHSETGTRSLARLARQRGWKRAGIFSSQQPWENLQGKVFRDEFTRLGGEISPLLEPEPNIKDLRTESLRIISSKPDGVFLANMNQEGIAARQLRDLGFKGAFYAALLDQTRIDEAGGALEGAISAQSPAAQIGFVSKYNARFGMKPTASADTAYDALIALGKAIEAAGDPGPRAVRDALLHVQFEGASGLVKFDDKGGVVRDPSLVIVSANHITPLKEGVR